MTAKRGQITIFMLLGLVIIATFAFVFYSTGEVQRIQLQRQAEAITANIIETTALENYISLCAKKALEEGLDLIGKQGGRIFPEQGGLNINTFSSIPFIVGNKTYSVTYGIVKEHMLGTLFLPVYPCDYGIYKDLSPAYCQYVNDKLRFPPSKYKFGYSNLPPLCRTAKECAYDFFGGAFSIQEQLEHFIANKTKECVDFESIVGYNATYNITEGNISVKLKIGENSLTALIDFPMIFSFKQVQPIITMSNFEVTSPARLKKMYKFANSLVKKDTEDLNFDILKDNGTSPYYYPDILIDKVRNVRFYDDLFRITDSRFVSGKQYTFQFMIENRPPVLDYISSFNAPIDDGCGNVYDVIFIENKTVELEPKAYDPDEDDITYNYSGWRVDYYENFTGAVQSGECFLPSYEWKALSEFDNKWLFDKNTGKGSLYLNRTDIGFHNFTVSALSEDFSDWQIVRVLVDDLPEVKANAIGPFAHIPAFANKFSVEDPFTLVANTTDLFNKGSYKYKWSLGTWTNETQDTELKMPNFDYDIINIKDKMSIIGISEPGEYEFLLEVYLNDKLMTSTSLNLTFKNCIPYDRGGDMFPYNPLGLPNANDFYTKHSCCNEDYAYSGTATKCYVKSTYGSYNSFNSSKYKTGPFAVTIDFGLNPLPSNNIFNRIFTRNCSIDRGNICVGPASDEITIKDNCGGPSNQCRGPAKMLLNPNTETDSANCVNYNPGETFTALNNNPNAASYNSPCLTGQRATGEGGTLNTGNFICDVHCNNGQCNLAKNCVCADDNPECKGLPWFASGTQEAPTGCNPLTHAKLLCNNLCRIVSGSGKCSQSCGASQQCEGKNPKTILTQNEVYNETCIYRNCGLFAADDSPDGCSDSVCIPGAGMDLSQTQKTCVECAGPLKANTNICELGCGASDFCDELPAATTFMGGICSGCTASLNCGIPNGDYVLLCQSGGNKKLLVKRETAACNMASFQVITWGASDARLQYVGGESLDRFVNIGTYSTQPNGVCQISTYFYIS